MEHDRDGSPGGAGSHGAGGGAGFPAIDAVIGALSRLRTRVRALVVFQRVAVVLAAVLGAALAVGLADYVLRTPSWLRVIVWVGGLAALAWAAVNVVWPAVKFRPPLSELALRIERGPAGQEAGLRGVLAAGVELAAARERGDLPERSAALAGPVVAEAARRYERVRASDVLSGRHTWRSAGWLGAALAAVVALAVLTPALVTIGAVRVLAPWSAAQWPKRTAVADATNEDVHPLGEALALRALVSRRGASPEAASASRVWANYRVIDSQGNAGPVRSVLLTSQDKVEPMPAREGELDVEEGRRGVLFERLIEPAALTRGDREREEGELQYWFQTEDDQTEVARVRLVEPPAVLAASAEVTPPPYVRGEAGEVRRLDLGPGSDERAAPAAMLAGSRVRMTLELNKAVPAPEQSAPHHEWLAAALGEDVAALADQDAIWTNFDGSRWELEWVLRESVRVPVRVTDEHGLSSVDEAVYRFDAASDEPPTVTVTLPESDRTVLPTAVVDIRGEGRDDVGLEWVALERRKASRPPGSEGAPAEAVEEWTSLARADAAAGTAGQREMVVTSQVDLGALGLASGDELWLSAVAVDAYELDGQRHEPVRSVVRRLMVISQEEFAAQVWAELGSLRRAAVRLDEEQERLRQRIAPGTELGPDGAEETRRGQAGITERLAREREALNRLTRRMEENRFEDRELQEVVRDAGELLEEAGKQSVEASTRVEDVARAEEQGGEGATESQRADAAREQGDVRDQLAELADLLDQGRDTWALRRAIERALDDQRALRSRTRETAGKTAGKVASELSDAERRALEQIADEQRELAERVREALQRMQDRRESLEQNDPAAAKAVEQAEQRGRQEQVAERMEEAAEQAQQNQGNSAVSQQDRAIQSLEQMLDDMEQGAANQDQELRRILADLLQSLDLLIRDQERELAQLAERRPTQAFGGLADGMVRLNQNTLRVLEDANNGPRELAPVAELIDRASDAQGAAVVALRTNPVNADEAQTQEELSLERLKQARDEAKKLDEQAAEREAERKAQALKKAYHEALAEQVAIAEETAPLAEAEPNRRTRALARRLGERQEALRANMAALRESTQELADAVMFSFAHDRLDASMGGAAAALGEGTADAAVRARQDSAIRVLQSLLEALERAKEDRDDFRDNPGSEESGGGGGSGGPPVIPPSAELRLLRAMQVEAGELTRQAAETGDASLTDEAAQLQTDLASRAEALLKAMMERQSGGQGQGGPERPAEPDGGEREGGAQ